MKFKLKINQNGFTLIETLVAISILLVSIVGPMEIASKGLFSAYYARDEITAYYLAQEAVEYVRNARDTTYVRNAFQGLSEDWLYGLEDCENEEGCKINTQESFYLVNGLNPDAVDLCDSDCGKLKFDTVTSLYSYDTEGDNIVDSKFKRKVIIEKKENNGVLDQEVIVTASVSWTTGSVFSTPKTFTLKERLFNWQVKN